MNLQEAMIKIKQKHPDEKIVGGIQTDSYFIFATVGKNDSNMAATGIHGPAINRKTGEITMMSIFDPKIDGDASKKPIHLGGLT